MTDFNFILSHLPADSEALYFIALTFRGFIEHLNRVENAITALDHKVTHIGLAVGVITDTDASEQGLVSNSLNKALATDASIPRLSPSGQSVQESVCYLFL